MLSFIFSVIFFLIQIGVVLSVIGMLAYDARVAYGKESFQDIWEELGHEKGAVSFIFFFLPTAGFFVFFSACDVLKPIVVAVYKAVLAQVKAHKGKKQDKSK